MLAEMTKSEAVKQALNGRTHVAYADAVRATFIFTGTDTTDWAAVPVKGMQETTDASGKQVSVPVFDFPQGYGVTDTPWAGEGCCSLCGHAIKTVYWIQCDRLKTTMPVGCECVTHFGQHVNGEKAAKLSIAEQNQAFVLELHELRAALWTVGAYGSKRHNHATRESWTVFEWAIHTDTGSKAKALSEKLSKVLKHRTGESITPRLPHKIASTDRVIANWLKDKREAAEAIKAEVKAFLAVTQPLCPEVPRRS